MSDTMPTQNQYSNTPVKFTFPRSYPDPSESFWLDNWAYDGQITNGIAQGSREAGQTLARMLPSPLPFPFQPPFIANSFITRPSRSFFEGAQNFQMRDFQYFNNVTVNPLPIPVDGWKLLLENISPNALHNSYARYDAPKCDEDTRVPVTSELMDWIGDHGNRQHLLCMTGAAGSGKSALQQTVAERCAKSGILGSAYFFSKGDPTRNTTHAVVPTMAFQLGSHNPYLKLAISAVVSQDPAIFEKSVLVQMDSLIVRPFRHLRDRAGVDLSALPHAILIDGLDESKGEDRQEEFLTAIRECLLSDDLPFRIFIASRPEWAIRTALEPGGHLHAAAYHIQLSDQYDGSGDMRRYLQRRFDQLSLRTGDPHWFTEQNIDALVRAASGQFIYVATVYRWVSARQASPSERLKSVLTWTPREGQISRPFEALDKLYTDILLAAKNAYEAVDTHSGRDFLLLFSLHHANCFAAVDYLSGISKSRLTKFLQLEANSTEVLISDLRSLVTMRKPNANHYYLRVFHKSFSDFLETESRAKELFVSFGRLDAHMAKCCLLHILQSPHSVIHINEASRLLPIYWMRASSLDDELVDFTRKGGWDKLDSVPAECKREYSLILDLFDILTEGLQNRDPEVIEVMSTFLKKWKRDYEDLGLGTRD